MIAVSVNDTPSVANLNTIAGKTGGVVTATLAANSLSNLGALTTSSTDVITVSVNDASSAERDATDLSALGGKTAGTVTVSNDINISGTTAEVKAALVDTSTKVVATTATVAISDNPSITNLNNIAAAAGVVTATIALSLIQI